MPSLSCPSKFSRNEDNYEVETMPLNIKGTLRWWEIVRLAELPVFSFPDAGEPGLGSLRGNVLSGCLELESPGNHAGKKSGKEKFCLLAGCKGFGTTFQN